MNIKFAQDETRGRETRGRTGSLPWSAAVDRPRGPVNFPSVPEFPHLIFAATFLPRFLGASMALAGLCWLAFLSPTLTTLLSPYGLALGMLGEASVSLWFLAMGLNVLRWREQASA
jgi:hypothetical protein